MLDILTPLSKLTRVSRSVSDMSTFVAAPGIWGEIQSDGSIANVTTASVVALPKMIISSASDSIYESNDVEVGRVATMESPGARCKVDTDCYITTNVAQGTYLVVGTGAGHEGKLIALPAAPPATYIVVARCEQVSGTDWMIYETVSPRPVVVS